MIGRRIHQQVFNSNQSWNYVAALALGINNVRYMLRIRIRRNAYDDQSYAIIEAFSHNALCWNELYSLDIGNCQSKELN